jgi:GLPGLI family protein
MKRFLLPIFLFAVAPSMAQKRFSEGTIVFTVSTFVDGAKIAEDATAVQMTKGGHVRSEMSSSIGKTITIFDTREGKGAVIRELGSQKILIPLNRENWAETNAKFQNLVYAFSEESLELIGFKCSRANTILKDSTVVGVFYTKEISTENPEVDSQFGSLPGMALQFSYTKGNTMVVYTATAINFDPVPVQKFDIPSSGYRVLSYEESKKGRR